MNISVHNTTQDEMQGFVFCCQQCGTGIIANSREHDECITVDGEDWYCADCHNHCPLGEENENEDGCIPKKQDDRCS